MVYHGFTTSRISGQGYKNGLVRLTVWVWDLWRYIPAWFYKKSIPSDNFQIP